MKHKTVPLILPLGKMAGCRRHIFFLVGKMYLVTIFHSFVTAVMSLSFTNAVDFWEIEGCVRENYTETLTWEQKSN